MTALERLYPRRCFDCQAGVEGDDLLCAKCKQVYEDERLDKEER